MHHEQSAAHVHHKTIPARTILSHVARLTADFGSHGRECNGYDTGRMYTQTGDVNGLNVSDIEMIIF